MNAGGGPVAVAPCFVSEIRFISVFYCRKVMFHIFCINRTDIFILIFSCFWGYVRFIRG